MSEKTNKTILFMIILMVLYLYGHAIAEEPYRVGTTAANFLEIGYGPAAIAMGDAYVSTVSDISAVYWNPAGLAFMPQNEAIFMTQPWIVDVSTSFTAIGLSLNSYGTIALSLIHMGFGEMEVTTLSQQEGTGELFDANEFAIALSYGRAITEWFAFGAGVKYVSSQIWHEAGSAIAMDLGVIIKTLFFSPTGNAKDGLKIGMSISNYGTKLRYDGIDLLNPVDISPDINGNYKDVPGQFRLNSWELPLIFRVGISVNPIVAGNHRVTVAADALHPNNNSESVNLGLEYALNFPSYGKIFFRGGYKALFMKSSEYGPTIGGGFTLLFLKNLNFSCDYAYRDLGILGSANCFGLRIGF